MSSIFISSDIVNITWRVQFFLQILVRLQILWNSPINKKFILIDLHFRHNISCFFSILSMKVVSDKATAELFCVSEDKRRCFVTESISRLNESVEWVTQWLTHPVICRHLLAILGLYLKYICSFFPQNHFKYHYWIFCFLKHKILFMHL